MRSRLVPNVSAAITVAAATTRPNSVVRIDTRRPSPSRNANRTPVTTLAGAPRARQPLGDSDRPVDDRRIVGLATACHAARRARASGTREHEHDRESTRRRGRARRGADPDRAQHHGHDPRGKSGDERDRARPPPCTAPMTIAIKRALPDAIVIRVARDAPSATSTGRRAASRSTTRINACAIDDEPGDRGGDAEEQQRRRIGLRHRLERTLAAVPRCSWTFWSPTPD